MKAYVVTITLTILMLPQLSYADFVGVYAGADVWQNKGDLNVNDVRYGELSEENFVFNQSNNINGYVRVEHPIPVIPNIRLRHQVLNLDAERERLKPLYLDNTALVGKINIDTDLTNTEATLYYEVLDNWISADLGLSVKQLKGKLNATGKGVSTNSQDFLTLNTATGLTTPTTATVNINTIIPMLYAGAKVKIPTTRLSINAEVSGVSYDGSSVYDGELSLQYNVIQNIALDVGFKAGYRQFQMKLKDIDDLNAETTIKGAFAGLEVHF